MAVGLIARDDESAEFFDATTDNTLLVQHCGNCRHLQYPLPFAPSTGRCRLVTWTHLHRKPNKDGTPAPVTTVAIVELDEGPWVHTQIRALPEVLHAGDRLVVAFDRAEGGEAVPVFEPAPDA